MAKKFNITGLCFPKQHYMADVSKKIDRTLQMVEQGDYFIINRPRQFGKTTTLYLIADALNEKAGYLVFNISFEGLDDVIFSKRRHLLPWIYSTIKRFSSCGYNPIFGLDSKYNNPPFISFYKS